MIFNRIRSIAALAAGAALAGLTPGRAAADDLTFYKNILPIFQRHCIECHHTGGSAPQSLETYKKAKPWLRSAKKTVMDKTMPPWFVNPATGKWKSHGALTPEEIQTIVKWVEDKAPEGQEAEGPKALDFSKPWKLGEPTKVFQSAEAFTIPAEGSDIYRAFVVGEVAEDTWLSGIELKPGVIDVVSDMWLSAAPAAAAKAADAADAGPGFKVFDGGSIEGAKDFLAVWNKGMTEYEAFPEGTGVLIPKGSALVLTVHYLPVGEEEKDQSQVAIYQAKAALKPVLARSIENRKIEIPADAVGHQIKAEGTLEKGAKILSILPRMHYLGSGFELTATGSDGKATTILKLEKYNYKLQSRYTPEQPISLPAGTKLQATGIFENTTDNPHNPNTMIKPAAYGPAPLGEVMSVVIQYVEE